ncbi:MAG: phage protein Gp36 family protein [Bacteroidota bacterium]
MPIITPADLGTNIYAEIIEEITREDATIAERAITTAIQEAKLYLGKYNLTKLFGDVDVPASVDDELLKSLVKDIACWHLLRLSNPAIDHGAYRTAYTDAIATLKSIMTGQAQPAGWPYAEPAETTLPDGNAIGWTSNPRRANHY